MWSVDKRERREIDRVFISRWTYATAGTRTYAYGRTARAHIVYDTLERTVNNNDNNAFNTTEIIYVWFRTGILTTQIIMTVTYARAPYERDFSHGRQKPFLTLYCVAACCLLSRWSSYFFFFFDVVRLNCHRYIHGRPCIKGRPPPPLLLRDFTRLPSTLCRIFHGRFAVHGTRRRWRHFIVSFAGGVVLYVW